MGGAGGEGGGRADGTREPIAEGHERDAQTGEAKEDARKDSAQTEDVRND